MAQLLGASALIGRLRALDRAPTAIGQRWGQRTVQALASHTPVRTGRTRKSYRVVPGLSATRIMGSEVAEFIDAGVKPHRITAARGTTLVFPEGGRTVFAKKVNHPGFGARPFKERSAVEGLHETRMADVVIGLWNGGG